MCIPTIPLLHCTQLPSGFLNQARYSAGSSIAVECSPNGETAYARGSIGIKESATTQAVSIQKRVGGIGWFLSECAREPLRAVRALRHVSLASVVGRKTLVERGRVPRRVAISLRSSQAEIRRTRLARCSLRWRSSIV